MKTPVPFTYALLVRSEEKSRGIMEVACFAVFILSAAFSIWQFAQQPVNIPAAGLTPPPTNIACVSGNCVDVIKG
jgi:hypothetical protein